MSQRPASRIDRFAQMSKQEELIAKKRQEILEKQRTAELAKKVVAQQMANKLKNDIEAEKEVDKKSSDASEDEVKTETSASSAATVASAATKPSVTSKLTGKMYGGGGQKRSSMAIPNAEQPQPKIQNSFCNDGSFLENFKKILEKQQQQQPKPFVPVTEANTNESEGNSSSSTTTNQATEQNSSLPAHLQQQQQQLQQPPSLQAQQPPPPHPSQMPPTSQPMQFQFNPALIAAQNHLLLQDPNSSPVPPMPMPPHSAAAYFNAAVSGAPQFVPPPPPSTTVGAAMLMPMPGVTVAPPPPPPPPQLPLSLASLTPLYMIPAPEPLQLNTIPQPKEFDLNAIPKPQLNLEAIQIPANNGGQDTNINSRVDGEQEPQHEQQEQQQLKQQVPQQENEQSQQQQQQENQYQQQTQIQQQQQQPMLFQHQQQPSHMQFPMQQEPQQQQQQDFPQNTQVFSDNNNPLDNNKCIQLPTSIENLIELVVENGDAYEETLRGYKNQLHPALWFLNDKSCEQYHHYRQEIIDRRQEKLKEQQQKEYEEMKQEKLSNAGGAGAGGSSGGGYTKRRPFCSMEEDKYDPESVISADNDSDDEYRRGMMDRNRDNIKRRIECRNELSEEERQEREAEELEEQRRLEKKKLRKSRWGGKVEAADVASSSSSSVPTSFGNQNKPLLSTITRSDPALLQYAKLNYGSTNLSEEDWIKCEEHYKVNLLYQDMMRKRQEIDRLAKSGKFKYEYDSDEDTEGGTWEHKLRQAEMDATRMWTQALTKQSEGKHHIGDFLPPEELRKFMEQYEAKKSNRQPDLSDYKEYKLREDNIGFQMLQKLGWKEGQGLGQDGAGIVDPVNKGPQREGNQGLGVSSSATPEECDNEYDAYRKRMMLAYRFRPNPLNNPRRAYY